MHLEQVLWVIPRVESGAALKREWQSFNGSQAVLAPAVVPADRMSQPRAMRPWLNYQAQIASILANKPELVSGLSGEQVWTLAHEYLSHASRLALVRQAAASLEKYMQMGPFAEREAQFIFEVSKIFEAELLQLHLQPEPAWAKLRHVVWFNDGEMLPGHWLSAYLPDLPVKRVDLPLVQGPQFWRQLVQDKPAQRLSLSVASDENTQAQQAAEIVSRWMRESPDLEVVIAVSDRLAARRLVPVLSDIGIKVDDRTGWRLSTSALAGWFSGLLEANQRGDDLSVLPHPATRELVTNPRAKQLQQTQLLSQWAYEWLKVFECVGFMPYLRTDAAGALLIGLLKDFTEVQSEMSFDTQQFAQACQHRMEAIRFKPLDVKSPVSMMPLLTTRLRKFRRVLVLGCAQSQFQESPPGLLPPSIAHEIGYTGPSLGRTQRISALWELASQSDAVVFSHAAKTAGGQESLLPELQYLDLLIKQKAGELASHQFSPTWLRAWEDQRIAVEPIAVESLQINAVDACVDVPSRLRVTALDDFAACPLRFGLNRAIPFPDVRGRSGNEFFALRGSFVHKVFEKATLAMHQGPDQTDFIQWKESLQKAATSTYLELNVAQQATIYPFKVFFESLLPRIAGRLAARAGDGWQVQTPEQEVSGSLTLAGGQRIELHGRVDRLEKRGADCSIVDIKFKAADQLKKLAKEPLGSPQLPAYQALLDLHGAQLHYLSIDKESVQWIEIPPPEDERGFQSWGQALWSQLNQDLEEFFSGQTWTMQPGDACTYCSAFGVCRPQGVLPTLEDE